MPRSKIAASLFRVNARAISAPSSTAGRGQRREDLIACGTCASDEMSYTSNQVAELAQLTPGGMTMRVDLRELRPNPTRDFTVDPIDQEAVEVLKQSINEF